MVTQLTGVTDAGAITFVDSGWTSRVYVVHGGRQVVKFPRHERVKREYDREIRVLGRFDGTIGEVRVPRIRWTDPENSYLGYDGIVGIELASHSGEVVSDAKRKLGRLLGGFLTALHQLSLPDEKVIGLSEEIAEFQDKFEMSRAVIERDFSRQEQERLESLVYDELPNELTRLGSDAALCHGDLGYWNVILTLDGGLGVIDFGDVGYYDRAKDFVGLQDPELLNAALEVYGDSATLRAKITIRQRLLHVLDLPFFIGKRDEAGVATTVAHIRADLSRVWPAT